MCQVWRMGLMTFIDLHDASIRHHMISSRDERSVCERSEQTFSGCLWTPSAMTCFADHWSQSLLLIRHYMISSRGRRSVCERSEQTISGCIHERLRRWSASQIIDPNHCHHNTLISIKSCCCFERTHFTLRQGWRRSCTTQFVWTILVRGGWRLCGLILCSAPRGIHPPQRSSIISQRTDLMYSRGS